MGRKFVISKALQNLKLVYYKNKYFLFNVLFIGHLLALSSLRVDNELVLRGMKYIFKQKRGNYYYAENG